MILDLHRVSRVPGGDFTVTCQVGSFVKSIQDSTFLIDPESPQSRRTDKFLGLIKELNQYQAASILLIAT